MLNNILQLTTILLESSEDVHPAVVVAVLLCTVSASLLLTKKASDQTATAIKNRYEGKIRDELQTKSTFCFVTDDEFIIQNNLNTFKAYKLEELLEVAPVKDATLGWSLSVRGKENKPLKANIVTAKKDPKKEMIPGLIVVSNKEAAKSISEFASKYIK